MYLFDTDVLSNLMKRRSPFPDLPKRAGSAPDQEPVHLRYHRGGAGVRGVALPRKFPNYERRVLAGKERTIRASSQRLDEVAIDVFGADEVLVQGLLNGCSCFLQVVASDLSFALDGGSQSDDLPGRELDKGPRANR